MALFRKKPKEEEQRAVTWADVWGTDTDSTLSRRTTVERALTCVPVFAATRLISDAIASLPLEAVREVDGKVTKLDTPMLFQDPTMFGDRKSVV